MSFHNKVVLVTGGGTGIGRATSLLLGERGAAVAVNYSRSAEEAEETVREIKQAGGRALAIRADVSRDDEVRNMVAQVVRQFGTIDYLVNNASITRYIAMQDLDAVTEEIWDDLLGVNVKGMFNCARRGALFERGKARGDRQRRKRRGNDGKRLVPSLRRFEGSRARFDQIAGARPGAGDPRMRHRSGSGCDEMVGR